MVVPSHVVHVVRELALVMLERWQVGHPTYPVCSGPCGIPMLCETKVQLRAILNNCGNFEALYISTNVTKDHKSIHCIVIAVPVGIDIWPYRNLTAL